MILELQVTGTSARAQDLVSSPFSSCLSTFLGERFFVIVVFVGARGAVVIVVVVTTRLPSHVSCKNSCFVLFLLLMLLLFLLLLLLLPFYLLSR